MDRLIYLFGAEIRGFRNAGGAYSVPLCVGGTAADRDVAGRSVAVAGEVLMKGKKQCR